jgi:hypothetical protein
MLFVETDRSNVSQKRIGNIEGSSPVIKIEYYTLEDLQWNAMGRSTRYLRATVTDN